MLHEGTMECMSDISRSALLKRRDYNLPTYHPCCVCSLFCFTYAQKCPSTQSSH